MWEIRLYDRNAFWENRYEEMKLIKRTEVEPDTKTIFEIDGKFYRWCSISQDGKVIGVKEITLQDEAQEEYGDELKCPYCGSVDSDAWELSNDSEKIQCQTCNSEIEYEREYTVSYTVTPVKRAEVVRVD